MTVIELAVAPGQSSGTLQVEVLRSPAGEASTVVALDVEALLARGEQLEHAVLASAVANRGILSQMERPLREIGQTLFSALLGSGDVAGLYRANAALATDHGQGLRMVLRIGTPSLAGLPWEAMYDAAAGGYVCRRDQVVRHVAVPSLVVPLTVQPPLRILGIVSSPRGWAPLDVDEEKEQLARALARPSAEGLIKLHWASEASWATLQDLLLSEQWHVIHFIGHGGFDIDRDEGVLVLTREDGRAEFVEAEQLVDLLHESRPMPRLVVLNSCSGAVTGPNDLFSSTAAKLVQGGVSAVTAMQYAISNVAATAFARGFYTAIAHGRGVDEATSSGRVAIRGTGARTLEWVTPVLYQRGAESRLFILPPPSPGEATGSTEPVVPASNWGKAIALNGSHGRRVFTHCQRCGYPFGAPIRQEFCNVRQACDRRLREPGYRVPKGRTQDLAIRNATIRKHPKLGLHPVESPAAHVSMCVHTLLEDGGGFGCELPSGHEGTHKSGDVEWPSGWNGLLYGRERQDWPSEAGSLPD